jgi:hypothetical protein
VLLGIEPSIAKSGQLPRFFLKQNSHRCMQRTKLPLIIANSIYLNACVGELIMNLKINNPRLVFEWAKRVARAHATSPSNTKLMKIILLSCIGKEAVLGENRG